MRKLLLAIAILALAVANSFAQPTQRFGLKLGVSLSNQQFDYTSFSPDFGQIAGTNVALTAEWLSHPHFNILTEFHFIQKGMTEKQIETNESSPNPVGVLTFKNRVNYFSVPVLAKGGFENKAAAFYLFAGPRVDFKLGHESTFLNDVYDNFKTITYGASMGLGAELNVGKDFTPLLEVRYSPDFTDSYSSDLLTVKNQSLQFLVGVKF